jgi:signal transduction histidine kinase
VEIVVRDRGAGIAASKLGRIWEPYVTHKPGGTGLGLAIVRQTLHAHGGSASAASTPGEGTTITLALPMDARDTPATLPGTGSEA